MACDCQGSWLLSSPWQRIFATALPERLHSENVSDACLQALSLEPAMACDCLDSWPRLRHGKEYLSHHCLSGCAMRCQQCLPPSPQPGTRNGMRLPGLMALSSPWQRIFVTTLPERRPWTWPVGATLILVRPWDRYLEQLHTSLIRLSQIDCAGAHGMICAKYLLGLANVLEGAAATAQ